MLPYSSFGGIVIKVIEKREIGVMPTGLYESSLSESFLSSDVWIVESQRHRALVSQVTAPFREWRGRGGSHPVYDFLFVYYPFSPKKLEQWHPGFGISLQLDDSEDSCFFLSHPDYDVRNGNAFLNGNQVISRLSTRLAMVRSLCEAVEEREQRFSCFGLHEWAMLYGGTTPRHTGVSLRLSPERIAEVVDECGLRCSHYDAYRFFTPAALPKNRVKLHRSTQIIHEQGGCIHVTMDLYKWCYLLYPLVPSNLLRQAFQLAVSAREIDMRSSPYDLSAYGLEAIKVEIEQGRQEFQNEQKRLSAEGSRLRQELLQIVRGVEEQMT